MGRLAIPLTLLVICIAVLIGYVWLSYDSLPEKVASHFDIEGRPNGWMSRTSCVEFTLALGILLPGFIVALMGGAGKIPVSFMNIPHRDYWLDPVRRKAALTTLREFSLWFASMNVLFVAGLHWLIVQANLRGMDRAPHLSGAGIALVAGGFLLGTGVWLMLLVRHFSKIS